MNFKYQINLPVFQRKEEILDAITANQVTIITGGTGSGKTTQLPLFCLEAGRESIVCTQPRRIAAISLANYIATSCNSVTGKEIGFKVRFREKISPETKIKFVTDGILLGEILSDPMLRKYDTIIIDEAHERSVNIDFLLGYLRPLLVNRPDLKVIVSSATIDSRLFSKAFNNAPIISVSGRTFPVEIRYRPVIELWKGESMDSYIEGALSVIKEIVDCGEPGDILVFLPTVQDIIDLQNRLEPVIKDSGILLALHSRMPETRQQLIFRKYNKRKIVIATNIAETSITVPGIRFVIDSGLVRMLRFEPAAQISRMPIEKISKASADQRAGRCGRVQDGICIRLYSESDYLSRKTYTTPEIQRSNLTGVLLRMCNLGLGDPAKFLFLQRPSFQAIKSAVRQLQEFGAINKKGQITALGREMARLPLDPSVARILIYGREQKAVRELMVIAAGLSIEDPHVNFSERTDEKKMRFRHPESDFMRLLTIWIAARKFKKQTNSKEFHHFCNVNQLSPVKMKEWFDTYQQIRMICRTNRGFINYNSQPATYEAIHKSLLSGFFQGIVNRVDNGIYNGIHADGIRIFPSSVLKGKSPQWVLFHEIIETSRIYGRTAAVIRPEWVEAMFRSRCCYIWEDPWFDPERGVIRAREEVIFQGMTLIRNRQIDLEKKDPDRAFQVFIKDALVKEAVGERFRFIRHNRQICEHINLLQHKTRRSLYIGNWALEEFYSEKLNNVKNRRELANAIKMNDNDSFLFIKEAQLLATEDKIDENEYPDLIHIGNTTCPVSYNYSPENINDGVVITMGEEVYNSVPSFYWEWLLPVFWKQRVEIIVNEIKGQLIELTFDPERVIDDICSNLFYANGPFLNAICSLLYNLYDVLIYPSDIKINSQPQHLWPVIRVTDSSGNTRFSFRTLFDLQSNHCDNSGLRGTVWEEGCKQYEHAVFTSWNVPFLKSVPVKANKQLIGISGFPALHIENDQIAVRIFFSCSSASHSHAETIKKMLETRLSEKLAWEMERITISGNYRKTCQSIWKDVDIEEALRVLICKKILQLPDSLPVDEEGFFSLVEDADERIMQTIKEVESVFEKMISEYENCRALLEKKNRKYRNTYLNTVYNDLNEALIDYCTKFLSSHSPVEYSLQIPRFLNGFMKRIEAAYDEPQKFQKKMRVIDFHRKIIERITDNSSKKSYDIQKLIDGLHILIEMYLLTTFSSVQLKKSEMIQDSDIQEKIEELRHAVELSNEFGISLGLSSGSSECALHVS